ncbi:MAG TPA: restriction endonuclease, partial [Leeuwenhoekiella sp.]|nr:restriction endonuclease [Leeuwenhoekiella sp.]
YRVLGQRKKTLWNGITIRPDIVIMNGEKTELIIDTKWKIMDHNKPSTHDLRQMYVYNEYWNSAKALLLYPSNASKEISIKAFEQIGDKANHQCGIATVSVLNNDDTLNKQLGEDFKKKLEDNKIFE